MRIEKIKEILSENRGNLLHFRYNGARNQTEEFDGYIDGLYNSVFTIKVNSFPHLLKCFNYSDKINKTLEIL